MFDASEGQAAPDLLNLEVLHALRRLEHHGDLDAPRSAQARDALALLPIARYPTLPLLPRIWELRDNLTTWDATYVALAEALRMKLVTADRRLGAAARAHAAIDVVVLGE